MNINAKKNTINQQVFWKGIQFYCSEDNRDNTTLPKQQKYVEDELHSLSLHLQGGNATNPSECGSFQSRSPSLRLRIIFLENN